MPTYSFKDTNMTIVGPGGLINLGNGAGVAEEGITAEMVEDANTMTIGADGSGMHSQNASKAGRLTVRLMKTSPVNAQLSQMYAVQKATSGAWGNNVLSLKNNVSGDSVIAAQSAFKKHTGVTYAKNPNMNEWVFESIDMDILLGGGILGNLASFAVGALT